MAAEINIEVKRGDTKRHVFTLKENGTAIDISGWTAFVLAVNSDNEPTDITNQIGTITGQFLTDGTDGKVYFTPPGNWATESYFYDAQAIDGNGEKVTFVEGTYKITQDRAKD